MAEFLILSLFGLGLVFMICLIKTIYHRGTIERPQEIVQKQVSDEKTKKKKKKKKNKGSTQVQVGKIIVNDKDLSDLDLPDFPEFPNISGNFDNFSKDLDDYMRKVQKYSDTVYKAYKEQEKEKNVRK